MVRSQRVKIRSLASVWICNSHGRLVGVNYIYLACSTVPAAVDQGQSMNRHRYHACVHVHVDGRSIEVAVRCAYKTGAVQDDDGRRGSARSNRTGNACNTPPDGWMDRNQEPYIFGLRQKAFVQIDHRCVVVDSSSCSPRAWFPAGFVCRGAHTPTLRACSFRANPGRNL